MDYVIIVAGGKGLRMGSEIPKQFLPVAGKPILMRTIERFHEYDPALNIILVLPESQQAYWHQLCEEQHFDIKHQIANGGDTRFQSSKTDWLSFLMMKMALWAFTMVCAHSYLRK